ncbi:transcriptional regulator NrdR [Halocatena halophila]|uniref:transcriptional regulator NrdR n=1 Tax=Halocatena halophila TaxID=2814576 RepID=UPI002ED380A2
MHCPDCTHERTRVVSTTSTSDGTTVRRRRECTACSFRFTTYEYPEWDALQVRKRDGTIEPFQREKVRTGIERATEKRSIASPTISQLIDELEASLTEDGARVVSTDTIGAHVADQLYELDRVAYIRFVSVYEKFADPVEFLSELQAVLDDETVWQADDDRNSP